jgi:hypothetical protein
MNNKRKMKKKIVSKKIYTSLAPCVRKLLGDTGCIKTRKQAKKGRSWDTQNRRTQIIRKGRRQFPW